MTDIDVSIIIVNYNTYALTCQCIQSVIDKTQHINYEIILVDNASKECDAQLFKDKFPEITLIKNPENSGFAKGNNLGISQAKGKYILLLNSDTELINNAVYEAYQVMKSDATIGVLSGKLLYPDGKVQGVTGRFPTITAEIRELLRLNKGFTQEQRANYYLGSEFDYETPIEADWVWGAFFLFPKEILAQFPKNKLHEDFFMYCEDIQWCWHIKKLGYKVVYSPKPVAYHYISSSSQLNEEEKAKKKTIPNLVTLLRKEKGYFYTLALYFIKALHQLTIRGGSMNKALFYVKISLL
jgi:GT2 family glycosyltransferase